MYPAGNIRFWSSNNTAWNSQCSVCMITNFPWFVISRLGTLNDLNGRKNLSTWPIPFYSCRWYPFHVARLQNCYKQPQLVQYAKLISNAESCIVPPSAYSFTFTTKDTGQYQTSSSIRKDTEEMFWKLSV
jgi:hypothetical protein